MVNISQGSINLPPHGRGIAGRSSVPSTRTAAEATPDAMAAAAKLRTLDAASSLGSARTDGPQAAQPPAEAASGSPARLLSALIRMLVAPAAGAAPNAGELPHGTAPEGNGVERPPAADRATLPRPPQELPPPTARTDLAIPTIAGGQAPVAPVGSPEHPAPRAELVPPGGTQDRRAAESPAVLPAALLAIAIPALAAVLASVF